MVDFHKVVKGNTLWGIARQYGTTVKELVRLNPNLKGHENLIHVGDEIKLPEKSSSIGTTVERTETKPTDAQTAQARKNAHQQEVTQMNEAKAQSKQPQNVSQKVDVAPQKSSGNVVQTQKVSAQDQSLVAHIIKTDKSAYKIDIDKMSRRIVAAADTVGIKPDSLAAIVKNESHFKDTITISSWGKGPTGITSIATKDMFARPQVFDSKMAALIKSYGSLNKVFEAKNADSTLNLGDFGEMLYKYKTSSNLYAAIQKDFDLNLRVGGYIFKYNLNKAGGNEKVAFRNYNGHPKYRSSYADKAMKTIQSVRNTEAKRT